MELLNIIILALIQGITEFLPISSSSHLVLFSELTNFPDQGIGFDIALHAGSLLAVLVYFRDELKKILFLTHEGNQYLKLILVASIPLPIIGLIFIDHVTFYMRNIQSIAIMTILFALLLLFADKTRKDNKDIINCSLVVVIFIGLMQTLAIIPGVSRAGIVITAALLTGFSRNDSIKIAFLLSIPAIFMASTYQSMQLLKMNDILLFREYSLGFICSFIFSFLTIKFFISTINKISFSPYIIYRIILGSTLLVV